MLDYTKINNVMNNIKNLKKKHLNVLKKISNFILVMKYQKCSLFLYI